MGPLGCFTWSQNIGTRNCEVSPREHSLKRWRKKAIWFLQLLMKTTNHQFCFTRRMVLSACLSGSVLWDIFFKSAFYFHIVNVSEYTTIWIVYTMQKWRRIQGRIWERYPWAKITRTCPVTLLCYSAIRLKVPIVQRQDMNIINIYTISIRISLSLINIFPFTKIYWRHREESS